MGRSGGSLPLAPGVSTPLSDPRADLRLCFHGSERDGWNVPIVLVRSSCSLRGAKLRYPAPLRRRELRRGRQGFASDQFVLHFGRALQECGNRTGRPASYRCPRLASGTRRRAAAALGELDQPHIVRPRRSRRHTVRRSPPRKCGSASASPACHPEGRAPRLQRCGPRRPR
jgi:hypothetical protein